MLLMAGKWLHNKYLPSRDKEELEQETDVNIPAAVFLKYIQI